MALYRDLNIDLTPEQISIKEETHRFAKEVLRPASLELDKINDPVEMINSSLFNSPPGSSRGQKGKTPGQDRPAGPEPGRNLF